MSLGSGTMLKDKPDGDPHPLPPGDCVISRAGTESRLVVTPNWRVLAFVTFRNHPDHCHNQTEAGHSPKCSIF